MYLCAYTYIYIYVAMNVMLLLLCHHCTIASECLLLLATADACFYVLFVIEF